MKKYTIRIYDEMDVLEYFANREVVFEGDKEIKAEAETLIKWCKDAIESGEYYPGNEIMEFVEGNNYPFKVADKNYINVCQLDAGMYFVNLNDDID